MNIGYARISTQDQSLELQRDALKNINCSRIFEDVASGAIDDRPGLIQAIEFARSEDVICVWRLDRLGRSLRHLIETINNLNERGVGFRSLQESLDTTTAGGRLVLHIFGALSEFERELIGERTRAGLEAARARGRVGGRPPGLNAHRIQIARSLADSGKTSVSEIGRTLGVSRATVYRALKSTNKVSQSVMVTDGEFKRTHLIGERKSQ